jgi:uncharacterized protein YoxC
MNRNQKIPRVRPRLERWTENAISWVGSKNSVAFHTLFFVGMFLLIFAGVKPETVLLVLTTIVSLEAIYLAIFIQMTVNKNTQDIEVIQEDVEDIQENVEEIQEDVDEIQKDVDEIQEDVDEIQEDVDEIQKDVDEIQEDVEEISEESDAPESTPEPKSHSKKQSSSTEDRLSDIEHKLDALIEIMNKK